MSLALLWMMDAPEDTLLSQKVKTLSEIFQNRIDGNYEPFKISDNVIKDMNMRYKYRIVIL